MVVVVIVVIVAVVNSRRLETCGGWPGGIFRKFAVRSSCLVKGDEGAGLSVTLTEAVW